ncbi:MAG TPA: hypothetical protein PLI43_09030 [Albidovulum sp.]|uniref:hypothetical protein n=1 Tax=Albidovulum sp. TaxID=1872424 RepID=UPI002CB7FDF8|nr:hypothetical protein [Albidovulum sp.]
MPLKRRIVMAGTTFFLAAATGHVMQNGDTISAKLRNALSSQPAAVAEVEATAPAAALPTPQPTDAVLVAGTSLPAALPSTGGLPDFPGDQAQALTSGVLLAARMDAVADSYTRPATDADAEYSVFGIPCGSSKLVLSLGAGGTLRAALAAPCHPGERVVFSHAGLSFAMLTDASGGAQVTIPAMLAYATVDAGFANGEVLSAARNVPDLEGLRRMALSGDGAVHLNAYEDGAAYGAKGHFSMSNPGDPASATALVVLGDAGLDSPKVVEIFTAGNSTRTVAFDAEAETTPATCGHAVTARVVTMTGGRIGIRETLKQAMPDCDAVGDLVQAPLPGWDEPMAVATSQ